MPGGKLRYIQLCEADFNFFQQFIFRQEAMKSLTKQELLSEERFSKKGSTAEYAKFDKILMNDLSRRSRIPMSIVSVDTAQCWHPFFALESGRPDFWKIRSTLFWALVLQIRA